MKYNLAGKWQFALDGEKAGIAQEFFKKTSFDDTIDLPTTTAEAHARPSKAGRLYPKLPLSQAIRPRLFREATQLKTVGTTVRITGVKAFHVETQEYPVIAER